MRLFFLIIMILHGLIHLLGFVKAYGLAPVEQLTKTISRPLGALWLLAAVMFLMSFALYLGDNTHWWIFGAAAIMLSQILIILFWRDARYGTVANVILLIPVIIALAGNLPTSYKNVFKTQVETGLARSTTTDILTEQDIVHLPGPVQKYLRYSGAIGKDKVRNVRVVSKGKIKPKPDADFIDLRAVQYNFFDQPARIFYLQSKLFGLPFEALHLYVGANATMQVKIASLLQVVDARGEKMNISETVTLFNDMCFLAPATLIDANITWQAVDSLTAAATFTNQGNTISATLYFNEKGELINFSSPDRYESADGKAYNNYEWTTPIRDYKTFDGRKAASYGEAIWHKPQGEFCYAKFNLVEITYNCHTFDF